jgi:hypothetical protein
MGNVIQITPFAHIADQAMRAQLEMTDQAWLAQDDLAAIAQSMAQQMLRENREDDEANILCKSLVDARAAACHAAYAYGCVGYWKGVLWNARLYYLV